MTPHAPGWLEILVEHADDELGAAEEREVADHIATCAACRRAIVALGSSLAAARKLWSESLEAAEPGFTATPALGRRARPRAALRLALGITSAAAAVLIVLNWHVPTPGAGSPAPSDLAAEIERQATSAQMLAAADLLADQSRGAQFACDRYHYIANRFDGSAAAARALGRAAELGCEAPQ